MFRISLIRHIKKIKTSPADKALLAQLRRGLKIKPKNLELYKIALIHKSASTIVSKGKRINNERLEYLGDSVLDTIVAEYLFNHFPNQKEGFLTKMRSRIVSRTSLNNLSIAIGLNNLVISQTNNPLAQRHIFGDALEALVGAIYMDRGFKVTNTWVVKHLINKHVDLKELQSTETDYKSRIIEWAQKYKLSLYFDSQEKDSLKKDSPVFESKLYLNKTLLGSGFGNSKKEAEQNAAMVALERIDIIPVPDQKISSESIGWEN